MQQNSRLLHVFDNVVKEASVLCVLCGLVPWTVSHIAYSPLVAFLPQMIPPLCPAMQVSALEQDIIEVDPETKEMLKSLVYNSQHRLSAVMP